MNISAVDTYLATGLIARLFSLAKSKPSKYSDYLVATVTTTRLLSLTKENTMTRILPPLQHTAGNTMRAARLSFVFQNGFRFVATVTICVTLLSTSLFAQDDKQAIALYGEAAGLQNAGEFELAVELWDSFVAKFPEHERIQKARHYQGVCLLQLKKLDKAAAAFDLVVKGLEKEPDFPLAEDALLNLAWCQFSLAQQDKAKANLFDEAAKNFREQLKKFPDGKLADQGWYFLGESLYLSGKVKESLEPYRKVVDDFKESGVRSNAMYALGVALQESDQNEEARKVYEQFVKDFADNPLVGEVRLRSAETLLYQATKAKDAGENDKANGLFAEAEKAFAELAAKEDFDRRDHAQYQQAYCLLNQDKYAEAAKAYADLAEKFGDSTYAKNAKLSAGKFFYKAENDEAAEQWLKTSLEDKVDEASATEAAHWLCRLQLKKKQYDIAFATAEKQLSSAEGPFAVNLKMDQADAIYEKGDNAEKSLELYKQIANEHSDSEQAPQATYNAAYTALDLKKYDDGLQLSKQFEEKFPNDALMQDVRYVKAECLMMTNQFAEAEAIYSELVKANDHPDIQSWKVRFATSRFMQKKYAETIESLASQADGLSDNEIKGQAQYLVGASSFYTDKFDDANNWLEKRMQTLPDSDRNDEVLLLLARTKLAQEKPDEALKFIEKFEMLYSASPLADQATYYHAQIVSAKGDFVKAATLYQKVIAADESDFTPYAMFGKALALQKTNKPREAEVAFSELLDKYTEHTLRNDALLGRGTARRANGDYQQAIADLQEMMANLGDKDKTDAYYELGLAQIGMKSYADAIKSFQQVYDADPTGPLADDVLYQHAWAFKYAEDDVAAAERFKQLMTKHADSPFAAEAAFHVGEAAYQADKLDDAVTAYQFAKDKAKDDDISEKAIFKLAWSYFRQEQYDKAIAEFNQQVARLPNGNLFGDALFMIAESEFKKKNYDAAIEGFLKAFPIVNESERTSQSIKLLTRLHGAKSANETKRYPDTVTFLDNVQEHFADSNYLADAWLELGRCYRGKNQLDQAIEAFEKAAVESLGPTGAQARCLVGEVLFAQKKHEDAIKAYKRVMYGYGGEQANAETRKWQALSGYEAGRCAQVLAGKESNAGMKKQLVDEAKSLFTYVVEKHAEHELAAESKKEIEKLAQL